jgi:hypothetical protein
MQQFHYESKTSAMGKIEHVTNISHYATVLGK